MQCHARLWIHRTARDRRKSSYIGRAYFKTRNVARLISQGHTLKLGVLDGEMGRVVDKVSILHDEPAIRSSNDFDMHHV